MTQTGNGQPITVRFAHRPRRGLLLGFTVGRAVCVAAVVSLICSSAFLDGMMAVLVLAPVWGLLLVLAFVSTGGRYLVDAAPTVIGYLTRRVSGRGQHRTRPTSRTSDTSTRAPTTGPNPAGTLLLPGLAHPLTFVRDEVTGAVMIHEKTASTLTAVVRVQHPAYALLSPDEQARRVRGWGRVLASLASSSCVRIQVLEISLPDSGQGITGWWRDHAHHPGVTLASGECTAGWAVSEYEALLAEAAPSAVTHRTLMAVCVDIAKAKGARSSNARARGALGHEFGQGGLAGPAALLRQEMTSLELSLKAADLTPDGWLDPGALATLVRATYDPAAQPLLERRRAESAPADGGDARLAGAGPVAVTEHWGLLRHDSACSAVLWISEWPRLDVPSHFLHALVFQPGIRKTLSITATPLSTQKAMRAIRKAKVEYLTDSAQKAKLGVIADQSDQQELIDVLHREHALMAGHADLTYTGLISVTAPNRDDLNGAVAAIERAAIQAGCETRRLYGQQAQAFPAAALPLAIRLN